MRSFRLVCDVTQIPLVEALLLAEGYVFKPEPFSPWCRVLLQEPKPLGSSLAAIFGKIYIQDRSSMLPPLALMQDNSAVCSAKGEVVLDMCASPGSKTGFLAQLCGKEGFVLGNEPSKARLGTLRENMKKLGFLHVATCSYAGETLPLIPQSFNKIQLDPPCSGWGTVEKNPQVLKLWQGDKVKPLVALQQKLLKKAHELLCPGGEVVYSTCTTNEAENEAQVRYAVNELDFECVPLEPFAGFVWENPSQGGEGTLRVDGARSGAQGFYIAKLRKKALPATCIAQEPLHFAAVDTAMLEASCTDMQLLPTGHAVIFGKKARFIPQYVPQLVPKEFLWQAAALGKVVGDRISLDAHCTSLMPHKAPPEALVLDSVAEIQALLQGQSVQTGITGRETGLYFGHALGTLPLGRIALKNGRALWHGR